MTNDAFAPLRAPRLSLAARSERDARPPLRAGAAARRAPQVQGRWSLTAPLFADAPAHGPRMRALAELLLERYGIVTRETVLAEGIAGRLRRRSTASSRTSRRSAPRGAATSWRGSAAPSSRCRPRSSGCAALRTDEPAGAAGAGRDRSGQPVRRRAAVAASATTTPSAPARARVPGAYVVTLDAEPVLYVERGGKGLVPLREPSTTELAARRPRGAGRRRARAARSRGSASSASTASRWSARRSSELLIELGFRQGPRRLTLSA